MPNTQQLPRSLDEQCAQYARRRGLAMPLAGMIVWTLIGIAGACLPPILAVWSLFTGAGFIAYLKCTVFYVTPCPVPSCPAYEPNSNDGE